MPAAAVQPSTKRPSKPRPHAEAQPFTLRIAAGCIGYAAPFCSTEETRYYLNGVFIEPTKAGPIAVATDGCTLMSMHDPDGFAAAECIIQLPKDFLIRCRKQPDALVIAKAALGRNAAVAVWLVNPAMADEVPPAAWDAPDGVAVLARASATFIDGTYPQWRKVFPAEMPKATKPADGFQVRYLTRFQEPAAWSGGGSKHAPLCILQESSNPAVVAPGGHSGGKPWLGVVMPMRAEPPTKLPKWMGKTGAALTASAAS